jgi:hypothetical protein
MAAVLQKIRYHHALMVIQSIWRRLEYMIQAWRTILIKMIDEVIGEDGHAIVA